MAQADHLVYDTYEFGGQDRLRPPRLPFPIWGVYGAADPAVSLEMFGAWRRLAPSDEQFYVLEIEGAPHLFHKSEEWRRQHMLWLLDAAKESGIKGIDVPTL